MQTSFVFYTLTTYYHKENWKNNAIYNCIKKNKILVNRMNQKVKDLFTENRKTPDERN